VLQTEICISNYLVAVLIFRYGVHHKPGQKTSLGSG